jgi:hypothetical protein
VTPDRTVIDVLERSAVVGAVDRLGRSMTASLHHSRLLPPLRAQLNSARARPGTTLLAAAAVHVVLQGALARPVSWYWLILPLIYSLAGALLTLMVDSRATPRD